MQTESQHRIHTQTHSKDGYCLKTLAGGSFCESVYCGTLCVRPLSGFVVYTNCWRNCECYRMGFHRLSLLLYHTGDGRSEECTGSRRYSGYTEKHKRWSCVEILRLRHESPLSIVLWQCHCLPAQGEKKYQWHLKICQINVKINQKTALCVCAYGYA